MRTTISLATLLATGALASTAFGQAPTTVQLPTFRFFTVQTTVSVPDSGGAYLGGINRARDASRTRGLGKGPLLSNRGISSERTGGGMSVHATIHDLASMDEALLAEAAGKRVVASESPVIVAPITRGVESVAAIRAENDRAARSAAAEIAGIFAKAQRAEAENKPVVAKIYYQMVARRDAGELKQQALERLDVLSGKTAQIAER